jgi:hypothetical protein
MSNLNIFHYFASDFAALPTWSFNIYNFWLKIFFLLFFYILICSLLWFYKNK